MLQRTEACKRGKGRWNNMTEPSFPQNHLLTDQSRSTKTEWDQRRRFVICSIVLMCWRALTELCAIFSPRVEFLYRQHLKRWHQTMLTVGGNYQGYVGTLEWPVSHLWFSRAIFQTVDRSHRLPLQHLHEAVSKPMNGNALAHRHTIQDGDTGRSCKHKTQKARLMALYSNASPGSFCLTDNAIYSYWSSCCWVIPDQF